MEGHNGLNLQAALRHLWSQCQYLGTADVTGNTVLATTAQLADLYAKAGSARSKLQSDDDECLYLVKEALVG